MAATCVSKIGCGISFARCQTDLHVLPGGVEHLHHTLVGHELEERPEVDPVRERVDDDRFVRPSHLHDAKSWTECRLAQEFGIDGDEGMSGEAFAGGRQLGGTGYEVHRCFVLS